MPATVVIADYDPEWPLRFEAAKRTISEAVGPLLVSVEHIGSTAVPGLAANPIIDIMPGLKTFEDGFACVAPLEALGYEYCGEDGIPTDTISTILTRTVPKGLVFSTSTCW